MSNDKPSVIEVQNAKRILGFLSEMKGVSYSTVRDDIFAVKSNQTDVTCIVDVEETLVLLSVEVCDVPVGHDAQLDNFFMTLNGQAVHGKFCKVGGKYFFRESLEYANLDFNELEASLRWAFLMVGANVQKIANIHATGEIGDEIDLDSDELDLEDLLVAGMTVAEAIADVLGTEAEEYVEADMETESVEQPVHEQIQEETTFNYSTPSDTSYSAPDSYSESSSGDSFDSGSCDSCD